MLILLTVAAGALLLASVAAARMVRSAGSKHIGTMSEQWLAEHRSSKQQ